MQSETRPADAFGVDAARSVVRAVAIAVHAMVESNIPPVVLCSAEARPVLKDLTRADLPRLAVLSQREDPSGHARGIGGGGSRGDGRGTGRGGAINPARRS